MIEENKELIEEQQKLAPMVKIPQEGGYTPKDGDVILSLDIQYKGDQAHVAGDLRKWNGEIMDTYAGVVKADVPYVPSYFCFREGPPLLALIERLKKELDSSPDLIIIDGHGIAHPRKFGVACWIGIATGIPTIGSAKDTLVRYEGELGEKHGDYIEVFVDNEIVGYVLRTQDKTNPMFVSPGHLVRLEICREIVLNLVDKYKIPEPLRSADHAARAHAKGIKEDIWKDLGELEPVLAPWKK